MASLGREDQLNNQQEEQLRKRDEITLIHPHELAKKLHSATGAYFLLDCRPILAFNSCHITGAVNVNFTVMTKRRFLSGKIALTDLVTTEEGKEKFKMCLDWPTVVYDEGTADIDNLSASNHSIKLVLGALEEMGRCPYVLQGGLSEFNVLHPSLCEISLPCIKQSLSPVIRASTPGMRDQQQDWQTAPPVHVLNYLVLGGVKDAMSKEVFDLFKIRYVLNVTPNCPNYFEDKNVTYKRISVTDTGVQKLSDRFREAFSFIEEAYKSHSNILIHCMAGVSRSVTLTIAYLMYYYGQTMQSAYQFVKDRRPAISPNLNFMGQLVAFETDLADDLSRFADDTPRHQTRQMSDFLPTEAQDMLTRRLQQQTENQNSSSSSNDNTPSPVPKNLSPGSGIGLGFKQNLVLKIPVPRKQRKKKQPGGTLSPGTSSPTIVDESTIPTSIASNQRLQQQVDTVTPSSTTMTSSPKTKRGSLSRSYSEQAPFKFGRPPPYRTHSETKILTSESSGQSVVGQGHSRTGEKFDQVLVEGKVEETIKSFENLSLKS